MIPPPVQQKSELESLLNDCPLTEEQAEAIYQQGHEAIVFALLTLSARLAAEARSTEQSLSTPSGMVPAYLKSSKSSRKKRPGRPKGHPGTHRSAPPTIHRRVEHALKHCPNCRTPLDDTPCETRKRITEDMPEDNIQPQVTEHTIHRVYCRICKKIVEPVVADALPGSTIGNHLLALTAWLHYGLGNTLSQIVSILSYHLHFELTPGGLVSMWHRLTDILYAWYEEIARQAKQSAVLHADETGWRLAGKTYWLWCFCNHRLTYYMIDRCRGSPALHRFFTEAFSGTLITDFWGAYNRICVAARQVCFVHLFREFEDIEHRKDTSEDWCAFSKKLRRLLGDALRLKKREDISPDHYDSRKNLFLPRLNEILSSPWNNPNARRLVKRLRRHQHDLFTFLDQPDVSSNNNHAEREIRPAVIIRKNILGNHSEQGANTQAVLMSIYRTLKLRGHDPIKTIASALAEYIRSGVLPPLPP